MRILPTALPPSVAVEMELRHDSRGLFARWFCAAELAAVVGDRRIVNANFSRNLRKGTIRGLHFQRPPRAEMKLVRCIRGAVFDVLVDIRQGSPTLFRWHGQTLSADNMEMLVVPEGFAHGFQALEDGAEVFYLVTEFYAPECEGGLRHDDPALDIRWPLPVADVSPKDAAYPLVAAGFAPVEMR